MSRRRRLHVAGGYYHVTLRGNHRQSIFRDPADRSALDAIVRVAAERAAARVLAYCWMTNHIHLLVQIHEQPLARLMQPIGSRYARYLQRGSGTTGHLFERRYHAVLVTHQHQLVHIVRYVHFNPVRAGLVAEPADYPWSSHQHYQGRRRAPWVHPEVVLGSLAASPDDAREAFAKFCGEAMRSPECLAVARNALAEMRSFSDQQAACRPRSETTLDQIVADVCSRTGMTEHNLAAPGRGHVLAGLRAEIAARTAMAGCATLTEVARRFNRDVSSIARAASRWRQSQGSESCHMPNPVPLDKV